MIIKGKISKQIDYNLARREKNQEWRVKSERLRRERKSSKRALPSRPNVTENEQRWRQRWRWG